MTLLTLLSQQGAAPPVVPTGGSFPFRMRRRVRQVIHLPAIRVRHTHRIGALVSIRYRVTPAVLRNLAATSARLPVVRQPVGAIRQSLHAVTAQPAIVVRFAAAQIGGRVRLGGPAPLTDAEIIDALRAIDRHRATR